MTILFVGNGAWGNALALLVRQNGYTPHFLTNDFPTEKADIVFLTLPTQAIRSVVTGMPLKKNVTIVNCAKGIEKKTHTLPFEILRDIRGKQMYYLSLIGPSFAQEVQKSMPTLVNLGYTNKQKATLVKNLLQTDFFRVRLSRSIEALELAAACKNVYAIIAGISYGLGFETNTRVKLMILAMEEYYQLAKHLGYHVSSDSLPGTIGDLILTCSSEESRNFTFGKLLTKYTVAESLEQIQSTVEGYATADSLVHLRKKAGVSLPLATFVVNTFSLNNPETIKQRFAKLVQTE